MVFGSLNLIMMSKITFQEKNGEGNLGKIYFQKFFDSKSDGKIIYPELWDQSDKVK